MKKDIRYCDCGNDSRVRLRKYIENSFIYGISFRVFVS